MDKVPKRLFPIKEASLYLGRTVCAIREMLWAGRPYIKDSENPPQYETWMPGLRKVKFASVIEKGLDKSMPMVYHLFMNPSELFKWRNGQGYTQKGLADLLGVDKMTVYRWEKAMREIPSVSTFGP